MKKYSSMKKNENKVYNQARRARPTERGDMKKNEGKIVTKFDKTKVGRT